MRPVILSLFILFFGSQLFAETFLVDECKTDIYFANGILTSREAAIFNTEEILKPAIIDLLGPEAFTQTIGKVDYAYNHTIGFFSDGIETFLQKFGWLALRDALGDVHGTDLGRQIQKYKASISSGHKVLVVAHSQGNLFTREAYLGLDPWMRDYFEAISVASPMSADIKAGTPRIDWDNDFVPRIASLGAPTGYSNNVRDIIVEVK